MWSASIDVFDPYKAVLAEIIEKKTKIKNPKVLLVC